VDRFGSSEQGGALFMQCHTRDGGTYGRCIGRPLDWVKAVILGDDGQPVPAGQPGLLAVSAPSVTSGYWKDEALTESFRRGGYWLTGDVALRDPAGLFYHLDRTADVVHTAAGPVYSVELEELLQKECDMIEECTIVGVPDGKGHEALVAVLRLKPSAPSDRTALEAACKSIVGAKSATPLRAMMVARVDEIPVGVTGKVLKRELRRRLAESLGATP
jgi:acyl-coenzyme A synthetase/AMP-(fatty) acid ligase